LWVIFLSIDSGMGGGLAPSANRVMRMLPSIREWCRKYGLVAVTLCMLLPHTACSRTVEGSPKIVGTHYTGGTWAPAAWSNINVAHIPRDLSEIKANGFNTIILVVPWTGFQVSVDPIRYCDAYFNILETILSDARQIGLKVIFRVGYSHEIGQKSVPDHYTRITHLFSDPIMLAAWRDYLRRLYDTANKFDNFLFGFVTWEDFYLLDVPHAPEAERLKLAHALGFEAYIKKYPLQRLSKWYHSNFKDYAQVPIPGHASPAIALFHEFWDHYLLRLQRESKQVFPKLSMEVRIDCDPGATKNSYICHDDTFDIGEQSGTTIIYYSPAWGAANTGNADSADTVLKRFTYLLNKLHKETDNAIFIDQFNIVDNTPGFSCNTVIRKNEIPEFIEKATGIIREKTIGYALWAMKDVRGNLIANGSFERGKSGWRIEKGDLFFDPSQGENRLTLRDGGSLEQDISCGAYVNPHVAKSTPNYTLQFNAASRSTLPDKLRVQVIDERGRDMYQRMVTISGRKLQLIRLADLPLFTRGKLRLQNGSGSLILDNVELYFYSQENGMYDVSGKPKPFRDALLAMNKILSPPETKIRVYYRKTDINPKTIQGLYSDGWCGREISGKVRGRVDGKSRSFAVEAFVPPHWTAYRNHITLYLDGQKVSTFPLKNGYNRLLFRMDPDRFKDKIIHFRIVPEKVFSPTAFNKDSEDKRQLGFALAGVGLVPISRVE
jgi:hypothetical protein